MRSLNIKDIAKLAGVGVTTVSRVLNNNPCVSEETRQKIQDIINKNGYIPNNSARNLKRTLSNTIGIIIKGITNPFFSNMIKIIEQQATNHKYTVILHQVDPAASEIDAAIELSMEKRLCGIIFLGGNFNHSCERMKAIKIPYVLSTIAPNTTQGIESFSSVAINDRLEAYKATRYLCGLGHKKIAIITAAKNDNSIGKLRLDGYKDALAENNIAYDDSIVCFTPFFSMESGYASAKKILTEHSDVTAFFCVSDVLAIGACKAAIDSGLCVPNDLSIMGFDGMDMTLYYNPSITTMKQPADQIARDSIFILLDVITNKGVHKHLLFETQLLERNSCCSPKIQK